MATITAISPYEMDQSKQKHTQAHRNDVETAIVLDRRAIRLEGKIERFDRDEAYRQRVQSDKAAWWLRIIFVLVVSVYVMGEFFASGDVAEYLTHQIAPLFNFPGSDIPIWFRRDTGIGFVVGMLVVTLTWKLIATRKGTQLQQQKTTVQVGDHWHYRMLNAKIWGIHFSKVVYLVLVAGLYVWLFGFAQERAALMTAIVAEQQSSTTSETGLKMEHGTIETVAPPAPAGSAGKATTGGGSKLSYATGVVYICLWMLHALVMFFPVDGFERELNLAHFNRAKAEDRVEQLRMQEERILRDILQRIHSADGEDRNEERMALLREAQPVAEAINRAARRQAVEVPQPPVSTTESVASAMPSQSAPTSTPSEGVGGGAEAPVKEAAVTAPGTTVSSTDTTVTPSGDVYEAIFGTRPA